MPITIRTTGFDEFLDPANGSFIKALILGQHGSGKTPSAAQWPKPIIADCERGLMSVARNKVPYVTIKRAADMEALLEHLRLDGLKAPEKREFQTLVIDTIDSYQRVLIQERLRAERKENLSGWADWGYLDAKMTQLIERMLNLPMNVVVNMHVKDEREDDGDNSILVKKSRLKGDIKDSIFQDFDLIGQMESSYVAEEGERVLKRQIRWHAEPKFPALRDRSGKLPRFTDVDFTPDDYWRIFNAITADIDDLPESQDVQTLAVEGDEDAAPADVTGGPVDKPKIPAKKTAAKKAPAKKAVKKAAPKPETVEGQVVESEIAGTGVAVNAETGEETQPDEPLPEIEGEGEELPTHEEAVELVKEKLGGEVIAEEPPVAPVVETPPPSAKKARQCGDQPDSMVGKFDPHPGCGTTLSADNAGRSSLAMLKFKTYLCDSCFEQAKQPA